MKHLIIGTAGHVDHGKTSLIEALTGTNTDRLKEEQERGMTIDIGFAALKLPDGTVAGIVDVPGHERFLKNMLAGATGVDVVLLVIAADEGVMPQTEEHIEILRLLEIKHGVIALTKCDVADRDWIDVVEEDIRRRLSGSFLQSAPIERVSSVTGRGIDALKRSLLSAVSRAEARSTNLPARLPIDRVFTRSGFGTVVTGTLVAGALQVGDLVQIVPQMIDARVRGLQVHNEKLKSAEAGSRVAVNIAGVEADAVARGSQLAAPGAVSLCADIDAYFTMASGAPTLRDRSRIRLYIGTDEVIGRVSILDDRKQLNAGEQSFIQLRCECEFAALRGDRFVLRSFSPMATVGGGQILVTSPTRHKKRDAATICALEAMLRGTPIDLARTCLDAAEFGLPESELQTTLRIPLEELRSAILSLVDAGDALTLGRDRYISSIRNRTLLDRATSLLSAYHDRFPLRCGMPKEELRSTIAAGADGKQFNAMLAFWEAQGSIRAEAGQIRLAEFGVQLNERQLGLLARIEEYYVERGIAVPSIQEASAMVRAPVDAVSALLKVGADRGLFHYVADGVYYADKTIQSFKSAITAFLQNHASITVGEFRDLTASNRKFALQALEYLDSIRFTLRNGDNRTIA
jgi:selenocysteine-specific elongation factor